VPKKSGSTHHHTESSTTQEDLCGKLKQGATLPMTTIESLQAEVARLRQRVAELEQSAHPRFLFDDAPQSLSVQIVFEHLPLSIIVYGVGGDPITMNRKAETLFNTSRTTFIGTFNIFGDQESIRKGHLDGFQRALQGEVVRMPPMAYNAAREAVGYQPGNRALWLETIYVPIIDSTGKVRYVLAASTNITDYQRVHEMLRQNVYQFRRVIEESPDGIQLTDEEGVLIEWNRGAEQISGLKREEVIGRSFWDVLYQLTPNDQKTPALHEHYKTSLRMFLETGSPPWGNRPLEHKTQRPDGSFYYIQQVSFAIQTSKGYMLCAITRDITDIKHNEQELQRAREKAEAAMFTRTRFFANMSHEIRTPLNAIIGMTTLLLHSNLTPQQYDFVETTLTSGKTLLTIINDILDFSKIEAGKLEIERSLFNLRDCIEESLDLVADKAAEKQLDLAYILEHDVPTTLIGDITRLRQVVVNLLSNAVRFTETGEVVVSVGGWGAEGGGQRLGERTRDSRPPDPDPRPLNEVHIAVRDTGIGIAPESLPALFQSFRQVDASTTRKYGGTGLGLAISKRLVEMMGGTIWAESEVGQGSTFHFTFQAALPEQDDAPPERYMLADQPHLSKKQVLLVDDSKASRDVLVHLLSRWGMIPHFTPSAHDTLALMLGSTSFDIAILNIHLLEENSLNLAKAIRTYHGGETLPIIIYTSVNRWAETNDFVENEMSTTFLARPIKPSHLYEQLSSIFLGEKPPHHEERKKTIGDYFAVPIRELSESHVPLRILVAEDNVANQKVALNFLELMGYGADIASGGVDVLEMLEQHSYDVIFMDVQMPDIDGIEVTRRIRSNEAINKQPWIIAMTAHVLEGDRERFLESGMDDYIGKPVWPETLANALHTAQDRVQRNRQSAQLGLLPEMLPPGPQPEQETDEQPAVGSEELPTHNHVEEAQEAEEKAEAAGGPLDPVTFEKFLRPLRMGGDALIREMVEVFIGNMNDKMAMLLQAMEAQSVEDVREAAHSLKSLSAQVGALNLSNLSFELEMMGRGGSLEGAEPLVQQSAAMLKRVTAALQQSIET
jgi:PAS domain S-box-containing protein